MTAPIPFEMALKSTMDKILFEFSTVYSLDYIDLEGAELNSEKLLQAKNALAWSQAHFSRHTGNNPFFTFVFDVGAMTPKDQDASQFKSMEITGNLLSLFRTQALFEVHDWYTSSTVATGSKRGDFSVIRPSVSSLAVNGVEGFRAITVETMGVVYG
jgi:hypothetical protein